MKRIYAVWARTNRRVRWQYADFCGRYESIDEAIKAVKERYSEEVEYMIENLATGEKEILK